MSFDPLSYDPSILGDTDVEQAAHAGQSGRLLQHIFSHIIQLVDIRNCHGLTSGILRNGRYPRTSTALGQSVFATETQRHSGSQFSTTWHWSSQAEKSFSSDGPQPHFITAEFPRKVAMQVFIASTCERSFNIAPFRNWAYILVSTKMVLPTALKVSCVLSDIPNPDSYTPSTLTIRAGTGHSDLQDIKAVPLEKPEGWVTFDISPELLGDEEEG